MWKQIVNVIVLILLIFFAYHYFANIAAEKNNKPVVENIPQIEETADSIIQQQVKNSISNTKLPDTLESSRVK